MQTTSKHPKVFSCLEKLALRQAYLLSNQASFWGLRHPGILQLPPVGCSGDKKGNRGCKYQRGKGGGWSGHVLFNRPGFPLILQGGSQPHSLVGLIVAPVMGM